MLQAATAGLCGAKPCTSVRMAFRPRMLMLTLYFPSQPRMLSSMWSSAFRYRTEVA